jgi:hypothetical protein
MPSPDRRPDASKVLGNIYKTRNFKLHKARLQCDPLEAHDARQVAAGVLRAAIEWRDARGKKPSDWATNFIPDLRSAASNGHAMPGVSDLSELLPGDGRLSQYKQRPVWPLA